MKIREIILPNVSGNRRLFSRFFAIHSNNIHCSNSATQNNISTSYVKYDLSAVPEDILCSEVAQQRIEEAVAHLDSQDIAQDDVDGSYDQFLSAIESSMISSLPNRTVCIKIVTHGKKKKVMKPWWNVKLAELFAAFTEADRKWSKARGIDRTALKEERLRRQKDFDCEKQKAKRTYWRSMQEEMLRMQTTNPKEYWKYIGKLGVAQERKQVIPWEVMQADGSISCDTGTVLEKWKADFHMLYNPCLNGDTSADAPNEQLDYPTWNLHEIDCDISIQEIKQALRKAKDGKAIGFDGVPTEVLRNDNAISYLHTLFNKCFEAGVAPSKWSKGIINPIPKGGVSDARDPSSYRGITIASSVYKLYVSVLNNRLTRWSETYGLLHDSQNGFRQKRSCQDHLSTLSSIIDTRRKMRKSTFVAFVDFSKAFDRVRRNLLWKKLEVLCYSLQQS